MAVKPQDDSLDVNHEINVTPFIDVMLVLLIIFMVAAPLATVSSTVELPDSNAAPAQSDQDTLVISLNQAGELEYNQEPLSTEDLSTLIRTHVQQRPEEAVYLEADQSVTYDKVMDTLNQLRDLGQAKVGLVGKEVSSS